MSGIAGLSYYIPWMRTESYIDTQLIEARNQPHLYPSSALIHYADTWFNLKNESYTSLKVPDEVRWQILFAAKAQINTYGIIELGANFSIEHLAPDHLVFLYRILNSYHNYEKTQYWGQFAIFHKHLEVIEERFKQIARNSGWQGFEIVKALRSHEDMNLSAMTFKMDAFLAGLPAKCFAPILKNPIGIPNMAGNCWANSLMQVILQIPSLEHAILYHPNFQDPVYLPLRNFLIAYRRDQEFGKVYLDSVSSQSVREVFHNINPLQFSRNPTTPQSSAVALESLIGKLAKDNPMYTGLRSLLQNGSVQYLDQSSWHMVDSEIHSRGFTETFKSYFSGKRISHYLKAPEELFVHINRTSRNEVNVPSHWHMPNELIITGENADYECDAFIISTGHDVAYVKRNGVFFKCDDSLVLPISNHEAEIARRNSSLVHFKKIAH